MKIRHLIGLGLTAVAGYKIYQNRQAIAEKITNTTETIRQGQTTLADIQVQKQNLIQTLPEVKQFSDDLTYKLRVFQQESNPHIEAIQEIVNKYKNPE